VKSNKYQDATSQMEIWNKNSQLLVAHACNPSYSEDRNLEDHSSKLAPANSSSRPYLKTPFTKIGLVEFQAQVLKKKKTEVTAWTLD
jgi:hypothetical protein